MDAFVRVWTEEGQSLQEAQASLGQGLEGLKVEFKGLREKCDRALEVPRLEGVPPPAVDPKIAERIEFFGQKLLALEEKIRKITDGVPGECQLVAN